MTELEAAARLAGVSVARVKLLVYGISGLCAGVAGLIVISLNSSSDANLVGLGMELDAIAAVAVGGTLLTGGRATVVGTLLGALIIQLVRYTLLANGVPPAAALVVKAAREQGFKGEVGADDLCSSWRRKVAPAAGGDGCGGGNR